METGCRKKETIHLVIPVLHELHSKLQKEAGKFQGEEESDMRALCKHLATGIADKCLSKLTWYHCAASVLYPPFLHHPALLSREAEVTRIRSDLQVALASFSTSNEQDAPRSKKFKKLLMDSESGSGSPGNGRR
jgi:hypothetical protein